VRVIAIDGPAGSGKSTVAKALADRLGLDYLDTGAMYRAVTFAVLRRKIDPDEAEEVAAVAFDLELDVVDSSVTVDGVDATVEIRGPEVTSAVSIVAANPAVRSELRYRQRAWADKHGGGVIEGRDIGSVVFPDAELKVYLTAAEDVRAQRRYREAVELEYDEVKAMIADRDTIDSTRQDSPLVEADDAVTVDTTDLSVDQIVERIVALLRPSQP
jgi:cytidylate kinase